MGPGIIRSSRGYFPFILSFTFLFLAGLNSYGQLAGDRNNGTWVNYNNSITKAKSAEVSFLSLEGRQIQRSPELTFVVEKSIEITFEILIAPSGKVEYVKALPCLSAYNEYRKGGINALYSTRFNTVNPTDGDQKVKVRMLFPGMD